MVNWRSSRVLIIGAARQGLALGRFLASHGADVVLTDRRQPEELELEHSSLADLNIEWALGGHPGHLLDGCDWVCPSGGVPLTLPIIVEAQERGIPLSNDSQIFLDAAPCKVIGITGSAGKTTTTTLAGRMVTAALGTERTWVGGNIGNPLIANIGSMAPDHIAVMELSSFQLEIMDRAPQIAAVLNITPNHLDRHLTMEAYTNAKANILRHQTAEDIAVLGLSDPGAWGLRADVRGKLLTFGKNRPADTTIGTFLRDGMISFWNGKSSQDLFSKDMCLLKGEHNLLNVLAACTLAMAAELPVAAIRAGVEGFTGVAHRLEHVRDWGGAAWYNDSIATAPERAMAAILSFDQPLVLLAGGRDKDLPWEAFAALVRERVDHLIIFGEARAIIARAMESGSAGVRPYSVDICDGLQEAVWKASQIKEPGDAVLLSPGGTSFDEFHDFTERGEWFRKWVNKLP